MTTTRNLPTDTDTDTGAGHTAPVDRDPDRSCCAGFYRTAHLAELSQQRLQTDLGLLPSQATRLSPADAAARRFGRLAQPWRRHRGPWWAGRRLSIQAQLTSGAVGALLGGLIALGQWLWEGQVGAEDQVLRLLAGLVLGAVAGAVVAHWLSPRPVAGRFDADVQQLLRRGYHAVVAHGVPRQRQDAVLRLLQASSERWCAEAPAQHRL